MRWHFSCIAAQRPEIRFHLWWTRWLHRPWPHSEAPCPPDGEMQKIKNANERNSCSHLPFFQNSQHELVNVCGPDVLHAESELGVVECVIIVRVSLRLGVEHWRVHFAADVDVIDQGLELLTHLRVPQEHKVIVAAQGGHMLETPPCFTVEINYKFF